MFYLCHVFVVLLWLQDCGNPACILFAFCFIWKRQILIEWKPLGFHDLVYCSCKYALAVSQWALITFKSTKYFFWYFLAKHLHLSTWLIAVGCFIFGTAVLIYLLPVWYLSMSKNRLNMCDMHSTVIGLWIWENVKCRHTFVLRSLQKAFLCVCAVVQCQSLPVETHKHTVHLHCQAKAIS